MNKIFADENFKSVDDAGNILVSRRNKTAKTSSNVAETNPKSRLTLNMRKQEQNKINEWEWRKYYGDMKNRKLTQCQIYMKTRVCLK